MTNRAFLRRRAVKLRKAGKTYAEINKTIRAEIPKSTLNSWFKSVTLTSKAKKRLGNVKKTSLFKARKKSLENRSAIRKQYLNGLYEGNKNMLNLLEDTNTAKLAITLLYLGEGTKNPKRGVLTFANSDPDIINLFLSLFRKCFAVNEKKFRCTLQGRGGQDFVALEKFWSSLTKIPRSQFYGSRIDPRTINLRLEKSDYKGVCRLDYLSAGVLNDILQGIKVITGR